MPSNAVTLANLVSGDAITIDDTNNRIGIGSTQPTVSLDVVGDSNISGVITASSFSGDVIGAAASFTGNVSIGGTLTYEDVTNIDSVGLITARSGVHYGLAGSGATITETSGNLDILTNGSRAVSVSAGGSVIIGATQSPEEKLDVRQGVIRVPNSVAPQSETDGAAYLGKFGRGAAFAHNNWIQLRTQGLPRLQVDDNGRVIIGGEGATVFNTETSAKLQILDSTAPVISIGRSDTEVTVGNELGKINFFSNDSDGNFDKCAEIIALAGDDHSSTSKPTELRFRVNSGSENVSEAMVIDSNLRIGIGILTPTAALDVRSSNASDVNFLSLGADRNAADSEVGIIFRDRNVVAGLTTVGRIHTLRNGASNNYKLIFSHLNVDGILNEAIVIDQNGRTGINTGSAVAQLTVDCTTTIDTTNSAAAGELGTLYLTNSSGGTQAIGQLGPAISFSAINRQGANNRQAAIIARQTGSNQAQMGLSFWTNNTVDGSSVIQERMVIDSAGRVGIGSTTPSDNAALVVENFAGNSFSNTNFAIKSYLNNAHLRFARMGTGASGNITMAYNYERTGSSEWTPDDPTVDRIALVFHPEVGMIIYHSTTDGSATYSSAPDEICRFNETGIQITKTGGGLNCQSINASPEGSPAASVVEQILDHYDVGSWTPTLTASTTDPTVTTYDPNTQGYYVRVGRLVYINGRMRTDEISNVGAGNVRIGNLPFTALNSSARRGVMNVGYADAWNGNTPDSGLVRHNDRYIELFQKNATNMTNQSVSTLATGLNGNNMHFDATYITQT